MEKSGRKEIRKQPTAPRGPHYPCVSVGKKEREQKTKEREREEKATLSLSRKFDFSLRQKNPWTRTHTAPRHRESFLNTLSHFIHVLQREGGGRSTRGVGQPKCVRAEVSACVRACVCACVERNFNV